MNIDEALDFLSRLQEEHDAKHRSHASRSTAGQSASPLSRFDLIQKYLEYVTDDTKAPQQYFTRLGKLLIDKCAQIWNHVDFTHKMKPELNQARKELYQFLENKSHYK